MTRSGIPVPPRSQRIAVLGSANMDLVVRVRARPRPGETVFGDSFETIPGGKGLNQAVAAARAGGQVVFVGSVGTDAFGDELCAVLTAEGISGDGVRRASVPTGTAHITVDSSGQNSIIVVSDANATVTADLLDPSMLRSVAWLVTQLELPLETVATALGRARLGGVRTALTPAPARELGNDLLSSVDLLVPNEFEAHELTGEKDPHEAARVLSDICTDVVVTLGAEGCVWARGGRIARRFPAEVVPVVDTTAAGDTFVGVLVALLSEGLSMPDALPFATRAASLAVGKRGATASMPRRAEILGPHSPFAG